MKKYIITWREDKDIEIEAESLKEAWEYAENMDMEWEIEDVEEV